MKHESLTEALAAFQAELPKVAKNKVNPHFKSRYASLEDLSAVVLPLLGKHGLAWTTCPTMTDTGFVLRYALRHASGESLTGDYPLPSNANPQQLGSALTYARRYCLGAVTGVAPDEDDDGNAASNAKPPHTATSQSSPSKLTSEQWQEWTAKVAKADSLDALRALWSEAQQSGVLGHVNPAGRPLHAVLTVAKERLEDVNVAATEA